MTMRKKNGEKKTRQAANQPRATRQAACARSMELASHQDGPNVQRDLASVVPWRSAKDATQKLSAPPNACVNRHTKRGNVYATIDQFHCRLAKIPWTDGRIAKVVVKLLDKKLSLSP